MDKPLSNFSQLPELFVKRFDSYIKAALRHALYNYTKAKNKSHPANTQSLEDYEQKLEYSESGFDSAENFELHYYGYSVKLSNPELYKTIKKLPFYEQCALMLHKVLGLTLHEIADLLSVSDRTVKNYQKQAIQKIKAGMEHDKRTRS